MRKPVLVVTIFIVGAVVFWGYKNQTVLAPSPSASSLGTVRDESGQARVSIYDQSRISKKPFGIYITPNNSPVQPEKFTGYHTGADFETTSDEQEIDVPVLVFCDGKLMMKKYSTGYGGVVTQACVLNGQVVTVVYGHLKLGSITPIVGQTLKKGDLLGILGKGYSTETDKERKHLHLSIYTGTTINILGYVSKEADLSGWLDPVQFFR